MAIKQILTNEMLTWNSTQWHFYQLGWKAAQAGAPLSDAPQNAEKDFWRSGYLHFEKTALANSLNRDTK